MMEFVWDWNLLLEAFPQLMRGLVITVQATLLASIISISIGLMFTLLRLANIPFVSKAVILIVHFLRGTPFLVQLYFIFYVLPHYGFTAGTLATGVIALGLSISGYMSEVFRASIESVAQNQWEACLTLGIPIPRVWTSIILPQAMRSATPMIGSYIILMFKETAILSTIGLSELLARGMEIGFIYFRFIEPLTLVWIIYFALSYTAAFGVRALERRIRV